MKVVTIESEQQRDRLTAVAADVAADHLWMASPKLKHPSFEAEEEWRLITYELRGPGAPHGKGRRVKHTSAHRPVA